MNPYANRTVASVRLGAFAPIAIEDGGTLVKSTVYISLTGPSGGADGPEIDLTFSIPAAIHELTIQELQREALERAVHLLHLLAAVPMDKMKAALSENPYIQSQA